MVVGRNALQIINAEINDNNMLWKQYIIMG